LNTASTTAQYTTNSACNALSVNRDCKKGKQIGRAVV
jgi:hypothetical protein